MSTIGRYCCKSRKSNDPKNLAKVDLWSLCYVNPKPLSFHTAEVVRDASGLKFLFELRAGGYGGSTYTLNYDAAGDSLRGVYDQVVVKQKLDVVFNRPK
jgi:hypothetical protein